MSICSILITTLSANTSVIELFEVPPVAKWQNTVMNGSVCGGCGHVFSPSEYIVCQKTSTFLFFK